MKRAAWSLALALTLAGCGASARSGLASARIPDSHIGRDGVPIPNGPVLAPVGSVPYGPSISGISCATNEQVVYHIHAHLTLFVDGRPRQVPLGVGIRPPLTLSNTAAGPFASGGSCLYWLHTHSADGVVHVESPDQQSYDLGQFFDIWGQALGPARVGPATGVVTAFVNGQPFSGDVRRITLSLHADIQLDVGTVVAPQPLDWSRTGL